MSPIFTRVHTEDPEVEAALARLVEQAGPELIVASGDLTNRGRRDEHERAHALPPLARASGARGARATTIFPYTFPARFTSPVGRVRAGLGDDRADARLRRRCTWSASTRPARTATRAERSTSRSCATRPSGSARPPRARTESSCSTTTCSARRGGVARKKPVVEAQRGAARARRRGRRPDPRGPHPPGGRQRAARVRSRRRRRARRRRLDRARARPAAARAGSARRAGCTSTRSTRRR